MIVPILAIPPCDFDETVVYVSYLMSWECHRGPGSLPSQQLFSGEGEEELHAERVQVIWRIVEGSPLSTSALVKQVIFSRVQVRVAKKEK
jgi:hypothetical protein